jgi:hypothetical protein
VEESEYERKPASYSELETAFSERSDGISGEVVDRTEATKPEASASSNELTTVNFDDPYLWPELSNGLKCLLIEHGPVQNKSAKYSASVRDDGRQFSPDWFTKTLPNGECVNRKWLLYSETKTAVFCFPCTLFGRQKSRSCLADPKVGFNYWRHLSPRIPDHENSPEHRANYLTWKDFEQRLKKGGRIDDGF